MYFNSHAKSTASFDQDIMKDILDQLKVANVLLHSGLNVPDEPSTILTDVQNEAQEV